MLYSAMTPALGAQLTQLLMQAGRIVVGAGWGLSSAAGLPREEDEMSAEFAPLVQAGLVTYAQAEAALTPEDARFWGYWFRRIRKLRFQSGRSAVHDHLLALLKGRDYAILTTTVDGLFYKSHVEDGCLYPLQGDLSRLHCAEGCQDETYAVLAYLRRALPHIDEATLVLPDAKRPRCPHCGAMLVPNIASMPHFCLGPYREAAQRVKHYLHEKTAEPLVLLEIGVGYGAPDLIRFPFEFLTESRRDVTLIRINDRYPLCAEENRAKAICIGMDAACALREWAGQ